MCSRRRRGGALVPPAARRSRSMPRRCMFACAVLQLLLSCLPCWPLCVYAVYAAQVRRRAPGRATNHQLSLKTRCSVLRWITGRTCWRAQVRLLLGKLAAAEMLLWG